MTSTSCYISITLLSAGTEIEASAPPPSTNYSGSTLNLLLKPPTILSMTIITYYLHCSGQISAVLVTYLFFDLSSGFPTKKT